MSKKFIPVLFVLILAGLFLTYGVNGNSERSGNDPEAKYQKILRNVGIVLEQGHYNPKKIDDAFSKGVLQDYIKTLDPDKYIFLQSDIQNFKKFENRIDDEIHGSPLESFYTIARVYNKRIDEAAAIFKEVLSQPFNFEVNEFYEADGDKKKAPANVEDRYDHIRKRVKYNVLTRFVSLQEDREKQNKDSLYKPDSILLKEATQAIEKQYNRFFETLRNHNSQDELFSAFVNTITSRMDPHTNYMAPIDKRTFDEMMSGTFYGIGAQLREEEGKIKIVSLVTGGPAWKSGELKPEDEILKIAEGDAAPVDVTGYALSDAVKLIRGEKKGTEVKLTVRRPDGTEKVISLIRDEISLDDVYAKSAVLEGKRKIGYILLPEFYANFQDPSARRSSTDVAKEVQKLKDQNVEGIIIDLRSNGGGSLSDVVDMVGLFIKNGPVVQVKGRNEKASVLSVQNKDVLYSGPLTVLVDEFSASASEIFAAAIQDYHRGIIIGSSSTYGKGTVQRTLSLEPQSENSIFGRKPEGLGDIKLTFRKFYRINGGTTQRVGVVPDIILPDRMEIFKLREKDNPNALGWDEIPKANYSLWKDGNVPMEEVIKEAKKEVLEKPKFNGIKTVVSKVESYRDEPIPLNENQYKEYQKKAKSLSSQLDSFLVVKDSLNVKGLPKDIVSMEKDSSRMQSYKRFIKTVSGDLYVEEAVDVMDQMIKATSSSFAIKED